VIPDRTLIWLSCAAVAALVLPIWARDARRHVDWLQIKNPFLLFILLQFAVWPALVVGLGIDSSFGIELAFSTRLYDAFLTGQGCVIAGLVAFHVGYHATAVRRPAPPIVPRAETWHWRGDRLVPLFWISQLVATGSFVAMMRGSGGLAYYIQNIDLLRTTAASGWGAYLFPLMASQVALLVVTTHAVAARRGLHLVALGTATQVAFALAIGIRHFLIAPIVGVLLAIHHLWTPVRLSAKTIGVFVLFAVFNMWYAVFRTFGFGANDALANIDAQSLAYNLVGRFHGGESMARIVAGVDRDGFQYGVLVVRDWWLGVIPRALWADKPPSSGIIANVTFWPDNFTLTDTGAAVVTLFGELYWVLGVPAVCLGLFVIGRAFRRQLRAVATRDPRSVARYAIWFTFALFVNESLSLQLFHLGFRLFVLRFTLAFVDAPMPSGVLKRTAVATPALAPAASAALPARPE
jgi:hypothetical protein